eukprot:6370453-Karenia_brevis.AAC.1
MRISSAARRAVVWRVAAPKAFPPRQPMGPLNRVEEVRWTWPAGTVPLDLGAAWEEFLNHSERAWCTVLDMESDSPKAMQHCGRRNSVPLKRFSVQATLKLDLPQAYTEQALHWRRLRKAAVCLTQARRACKQGSSMEAMLTALERFSSVQDDELGNPYELERVQAPGDEAVQRNSLANMIAALRWGDDMT